MSAANFTSVQGAQCWAVDLNENSSLKGSKEPDTHSRKDIDRSAVVAWDRVLPLQLITPFII